MNGREAAVEERTSCRALHAGEGPGASGKDQRKKKVVGARVALGRKHLGEPRTDETVGDISRRDAAGRMKKGPI